METIIAKKIQEYDMSGLFYPHNFNHFEYYAEVEMIFLNPVSFFTYFFYGLLYRTRVYSYTR